MTYAYIRVSTGKQDADNQKTEIEKFCESRGIIIDHWVKEVVSGAKDYKDRELGDLLKTMESGDLVICSELSRLGRTLYMIFEILKLMSEKGIHLHTIKDNFTLQDDTQSKVLAFAFGLSAEIERNLISQRTIAALERKKAEGVILGRKPGSKNKTVKLTAKEPAIRVLLNEGHNMSQIARLLHVDRTTLTRYVQNRMNSNKGES